MSKLHAYVIDSVLVFVCLFVHLFVCLFAEKSLNFKKKVINSSVHQQECSSQNG